MESLRILVVADRALAALLQTYFKGEGMVVDTATDGSAALNIAKGSAPDVVILDVVTPEMDGLTVLKELRSLPGTKDCEIVVLTRQPLESSESGGGELDADDFMTKPFETEALLSTVQRIAAQRHAARSAASATASGDDDETVDALQKRVASGEPLAVVHARLENLDGLRNSYGPDIVEKVIKSSTRLVKEAAMQCGEPLPLVEHCDDESLLILLQPDQINRFCKAAIRDYDRAMIIAFYGAEYVDTGKDSGAVPPATLSMGVATNIHRPFESAAQAAAIAAEMAAHAGRDQRSSHEVDRRR